jgi:isopentenyl-diphosphate Delta-isomerase
MSRSSRKMDHVRHALSIGQQGHNGLNDIRFIHNPLPESSTDQISLTSRIGDLTLSSPILINAMTGGAEGTERINFGLASAARETGIAMAVGSQMSAVRDKRVAYSYSVARQANPNGILIANLGSEASLEQAQEAIEMIEANALQIHLNAVQELVMQEGDRSFTGALRRIERIVHGCGVPVIVKEVGFGMTAKAASRLLALGVSAVDCGGYGGTNFARIENARRDKPLECFDDWGNSTSVSLLELLEAAGPERSIASGGIGSSLDTAKALALGAGAVGIAGAFLRALVDGGIEALVKTIESWHEELRFIIAAVGTNDLADLRRSPLLISGETAHWCWARGIDIRKYAQRDPSAPPE